MARTLNYRSILYKRHGYYVETRRILFALAVILFLHCAFTVNAAPEDAAATDVEINGLHIKADRIAINSTHSFTELIGNVKITQGSTAITADNVKIFTKSTHADNEEGATAKSIDKSIERLVANGNVRIELDNGVATSEKADYNAETKIIVLSGSGTKFTSGDNTITGRTITVDRRTGDVTVEDAEADIFSEEQL